MKLIFVAALAAAGTCTPSSAPNPHADLAAAACARLSDAGCPLGDDPNCEAAFRLPSRFGADPACVLAADAGFAACNVTCVPAVKP
jgi:hypothetical protein